MILSVSRRTDIPNYYSDWFYNRIKEGFACVRNPVNPHQVSRIALSPQVVDCIVFWTKNPAPMLERLEELRDYSFYFQFTLTGYGRDIEPNVPHKREYMIDIFRRLAQQTGSRRVIWRYDPILFTDIYTREYHLRAFEQIAGALRGYTEKCVISFVDLYAKNQKKLRELKVQEKPMEELRDFARKLSGIARAKGMTIASCAEKYDLADCGVEHNCCIDKVLVEELAGCRIKAAKDRNQRAECGCIESIDIGTYDTCKNGCIYCYACFGRERIPGNSRPYDADSPLLCSRLTEQDRVTLREVKSFR